MKKILIIPLLIILSFFNIFIKNQEIPSDNNLLAIHIIDVGQGDCILIQSPSHNVLVDGGDENSFDIIDSYLKNLKIKDIHTIIASHFDSDHIGSLDDIVTNYNVSYVYAPCDNKISDSVNEFIDACNSSNLNINTIYKNDTITIDNELIFNILSPSYINNDDSNSNSIVFEFKFGDKSFLFTGDATSSNEHNIIDSYILDDVDFLKVSHHGSGSSTSLEFLEEITPDISVISCGYNNSYNHPHKDVIYNLNLVDSSIYRTDTMGDLVFYCDGNTIFTTKNYLME